MLGAIKGNFVMQNALILTCVNVLRGACFYENWN
jgi:hypothetical protein